MTTMNAAAAVAAPPSPSAAAASVAVAALSGEQQLALLLQRLKQPATLPLSASHIRQTLADFRSLLLLSEAATAADADAAENGEAATAMATDADAAASPSPLVASFCAQHGHAFLTAWMWRREIISEIATQLMDCVEEYVLVWYADPFPATDAFQALAAATRSVAQWSAGAAGPSSASARAVHSLLRTALQRFIDLQPRVAQLLEEVCTFEARRAHAKGVRDGARLAASQTAAAARAQIEREVQRANAAVAQAASAPSAAATVAAPAPLSPQSQMLLDTLCSLPDLLANALHGDLPYSLSHRAWHTAVVAQMQLFISSHSALSERSPVEQSPSYLTPLSGLLAKLVRLGQSEVLLDGLLEPLLLHLQSLQSPPAAASSSVAAAASSATSSSPLIAAYARVFQGVGVQAQEKLIESILQWLGSRLYALHAARMSDSEGAHSSTDPSERALLAVMPVLFPLAYFSTSPFFSLLVSQRLLVSKTSLTLPALRVLVDYLWQLSAAVLAGLSAADADRARSNHLTLLDHVLTTVLQMWSGGEQSTSATGVQRVSHSMAAESQVYLGKAALLMLLKIEKELCGGGPLTPQQRAARAQKKKAEGETEEAFKQLGSFAHSASVPLLLTGIHSRLSSPLPPVRAVSMAIARVFSRLMGGAESEIDFGEGDAAALEDEEAKEAEEAKRNQAAALNPATIINPQHLAVAAASSGASSGPPLHAHSLSDDEKDLRKVRLPFFLRDALEMIHKNADSSDHIEAALECLPPLIARHPADLRLLARDLMAALLNLGSNVFLETTKKLAVWRTQAMVALCSTPGGRGGSDVAALSESVAYLIAQFWSPNYSIGTRLEILDVLRMAAERLADMHGEGDAAAKAGTAAIAPGKAAPLIQEVTSASSRPALVPVNTPSYSSSSAAQAVSATLAHHQSIIAERVEKRTRRWGSTKTAMAAAATASSSASKKQYSVNRFAPVAHLFFFPLMRQIDSPAAQNALQQHDSLLLLRLLHTVSALLPCSSGLSQSLPLVTRTMARSLMDFLLVTAARTHAAAATGAAHAAQQIGMRRMIFFALSRILVCYNEQLFADDFAREIPELVSWLTDSVQNDKDLECRQLAQACLYFLKQLLGNPFEALFKAEANTASHAASIAGAALPALRF